jgi:hypothetical protein
MFSRNVFTFDYVAERKGLGMKQFGYRTNQKVTSLRIEEASNPIARSFKIRQRRKCFSAVDISKKSAPFDYDHAFSPTHRSCPIIAEALFARLNRRAAFVRNERKRSALGHFTFRNQ